MSFITDKQTLEDLNILGKFKSNSIYKLFNNVQTSGAERLLEEMFTYPLTNEKLINDRVASFSYFQRKKFIFPFDAEQVIRVEDYLSTSAGAGALAAGFELVKKKGLKYLGLDKEYMSIQNGMMDTVQLLNQSTLFLNRLKNEHPQNDFQERINQTIETCCHPKLSWMNNTDALSKDISLLKLIRYDYLLRGVFHEKLKQLLYVIYEIDVFITVSGIARQNNFSYAKAMPKAETSIKISNVRHPGLKHGVTNSIAVNRDQNVIFLTGANMAGKSTFMKSFGVSVYLAHMGFPVAVEEMEFSIQDGIYTSINVPDNLNMGYSHFYAEVLRVKKVAEMVASSKNLVVIFDELFKGTNVKDAHDATVAVTAGFSTHRNCSYIISTHIIEVADELKVNNNFQFVYLPTIMDGNVPKYTYKLEQGVTADRHGMMIIDNEGIVELITGR